MTRANAAPHHVCSRVVGTDHINALGHLEAGRYVILFETAIAPLFETIGLTNADLIARTPAGATLSPFLVEMHVTYQAELAAGDAVAITAQLLEHDARRARIMLQMTRSNDSRRAATCELLILNMDVTARKPAPWSDLQTKAWHSFAAMHSGVDAPAEAGRGIAPLKV